MAPVTTHIPGPTRPAGRRNPAARRRRRLLLDVVIGLHTVDPANGVVGFVADAPPPWHGRRVRRQPYEMATRSSGAESPEAERSPEAHLRLWIAERVDQPRDGQRPQPAATRELELLAHGLSREAAL